MSAFVVYGCDAAPHSDRHGLWHTCEPCLHRCCAATLQLSHVHKSYGVVRFVDPQARHLMCERLQNLLQQGKAILPTTHVLDEAGPLCGRRCGRACSARAAGRGQRRDDVRPCAGCPAAARRSDAESRRALPAPPGQPGRPVPETHRPADTGRRLKGRPQNSTTMLVSTYAAPRLSGHFRPVFMRNWRVWQKLVLVVPSVIGNIAEPLITLVEFGYGLGALVEQIDGKTYIESSRIGQRRGQRRACRDLRGTVFGLFARADAEDPGRHHDCTDRPRRHRVRRDALGRVQVAVLRGRDSAGHLCTGYQPRPHDAARAARARALSASPSRRSRWCSTPWPGVTIPLPATSRW